MIGWTNISWHAIISYQLVCTSKMTGKSSFLCKSSLRCNEFYFLSADFLLLWMNTSKVIGITIFKEKMSHIFIIINPLKLLDDWSCQTPRFYKIPQVSSMIFFNSKDLKAVKTSSTEKCTNNSYQTPIKEWSGYLIADLLF